MEENALKHGSGLVEDVAGKEAGKIGLSDDGWPWMPVENVWRCFEEMNDIKCYVKEFDITAFPE